MKSIEYIHVELTPLQILVANKLRRNLPDFSCEELARHIVALGILALDDEQDDEPPKATNAFGLPHRSIGDLICVSLPEELRLRLEKLLTVCPTMQENDAFTTLMDLGAETLIELGVIRGKDLAVPRGER